MQYEKEVVLSIRHRIEIRKQERFFQLDVAEAEGHTDAAFKNSHIHLGSRQRAIQLTSYEQDLEEQIGFHGFGDCLARFVRDHTPVEVYGSDFEGDGFEGHQLCIYWCKVFFLAFIFDS